MKAGNFWVDGNNWAEAEKSLTDARMLSFWIGGRQHQLRAMTERLRESWIEDASYYEVRACDDVGTWEYSPDGGILPIDYMEMLPALRHPCEGGQLRQNSLPRDCARMRAVET